MATTPTYNIGPAAIATPSETGGPPFTLSKAEWLTIQTYVNNALALPTTMDQFKNSLGPGAPSDLSDFNAIVDAYQVLNGHCVTWQKTTFPSSVALADSVYDYGINKVPVYYPAILKEANILIADPNNAQAKQALAAIIGVLETAATGYATQATTVADAIQQFATDTQADKTTLVGPNGGAGLQAYYNGKYGSASADVQAKLADITAQQIVLKSAMAEYTHDVTVAATSATYAWVPVVGWIAAAVVAGIYGHKAVEALDEANDARDQIAKDNAIIQADFNLMLAINTTELGLSTIVDALSAALPVIEKLQGVWGAMAADLAAIGVMIENDIASVPPIIMNLGVDEATKAWYNVAQAANAYRVNAYVQDSGTTPSMLAWKVENHMASSAAQPVALAA